MKAGCVYRVTTRSGGDQLVRAQLDDLLLLICAAWLVSVSIHDDYVRVMYRTGMDYSYIDRNGVDELCERFYL